MRVKTLVPKEAIFCQDNYDPTDYFRYCCPVCLRYFNYILVSSCCQNYICRLCTGQMAKKAKFNYNYTCRCVHCMNEDFTLNDVDPRVPAKEYTDTPAKYRRQLTRVATPVRFSLDSERFERAPSRESMREQPKQVLLESASLILNSKNPPSPKVLKENQQLRKSEAKPTLPNKDFVIIH